MNNPCKKETLFSVDYNDINRYIADCLGIPTFEGHDESPNDTSHEYSVDAEPPSKWDEDDLESILKHKGCAYWQLGTVLRHLCRLGYLTPGDYVVRVCW